MRDCVLRLLEMGAEAFPDSFTWRKARHMIAIGFHEDGRIPDEAKNALRNWARETRNLTPNEERNQVTDFVDWLYRRDKAATISCAPTATMVQQDWCVGAKCKFREEQRREHNAQRKGDFNIVLWQKWLGYLIRQYRNGVYIAATYEALRDVWLERDLVDGQPVYVGCRILTERARRRVDKSAPRRSTKDHRMAALRWAHVLEEEKLIRFHSRGEGMARRGFRRANGYVLLPLPPVPDESCGGVAAARPHAPPLGS